jgi:hypothetical protein
MSPIMSATEITKLSWAQRIESYETVPSPYKSFFGPLLAQGRIFPYSVLTPPHEGFLHPTTEKLVCDLGDEINVLERSGNSFLMFSFPLESISYIEVRTVLLDSRIKITGITRQGTPASITLKFNSVTDYLLRPILARMRHGPVDPKNAVKQSELDKFNPWMRLNFKFMNYAKHSLLGGETVEHAILQPEIRNSLFTFLGKTIYRTISPTHVSILTERELIMIREEPAGRGNEKYGGVWDYIPLNKIMNLIVNAKEGNLLVLSIRLPESERLDFLYQASIKEEIEQLLERFKVLTTS